MKNSGFTETEHRSIGIELDRMEERLIGLILECGGRYSYRNKLILRVGSVLNAVRRLKSQMVSQCVSDLRKFDPTIYSPRQWQSGPETGQWVREVRGGSNDHE